MATRYVSLKETNVELRKALKEAFPGVKFSVVGESYAGGASARVRYVDGPKVKDVEKVAKQFEAASFDGMIDLKSYHTSEYKGEEVYWGADYVFVNQEFSEEVTSQAKEFVELAIAEDGGTPGPGWWGEFPQAFHRARKDDESFRWGEQNYWSLVNIASVWLVEGRTLMVKVVA